jgi:hypothetical protein
MVVAMWSDDRAKSSPAVPADPRAAGFDMVVPLKHKVTGHPFKADVDLAELDDRRRPGPAWVGRAQTLSRSHVVVLSRRMSYPGRVLLVAIHMIDARPTPLVGCVLECEYHADGLYRIVLELLPLPDSDTVNGWFPNGGLK